MRGERGWGRESGEPGKKSEARQGKVGERSLDNSNDAEMSRDHIWVSSLAGAFCQGVWQQSTPPNFFVQIIKNRSFSPFLIVILNFYKKINLYFILKRNSIKNENYNWLIKNIYTLCSFKMKSALLLSLGWCKIIFLLQKAVFDVFCEKWFLYHSLFIFPLFS